MLIYNVTVAVDRGIENDWLVWMKQTHVLDVMATGMFVSSKIYRVIGIEEGESVSYAVQFTAKSLNDVNLYLTDHAPRLRQLSQEKFGDKQVAFRTLLEEVE
jgi:hypothetical protein